jgi:XTP/dITP diphosphohydrolase
MAAGQRRRILIATGNPGKRREIEAVMADVPVDWVSLADMPDLPDCVEDADTFEANARKKALHYAGLSGLWTLADDSGLEVDALGGAPGVHSARYAGEPKSDARNNAKLVAGLTGVPDERRTARFRCVVALAEPGRVLATASGTIEGRIIDSPRGRNGFGYDPHFLIPDLGKTAAELPAAEKNRISHRGRALAALRQKLSSLLDAPHARP